MLNVKTKTMLLFILFTLFSSTAWADFEMAEAANQKGDRQTAFKEYYKAANANDTRAFGKLASMYLYGLGTEKNYTLAFAWFGIAELSGDKYSAQFKKAAASSMTREEIEKADAIFKQLSQKLELDQPKK